MPSAKSNKVTSTPFPHVSFELLAALEAKFPNRCPDPGAEVRQIDMAIGSQSVVRLLRREFEKQQNPFTTWSTS